MARNALEVAKTALTYWRRRHGNASLYLWCQRYDGYYWDEAYQGWNSSIITYASARLAYQASTIFTRSINSSALEPGDNLWWKYGTADHVATYIGHHRGRALVTDTARGGTILFRLTNDVAVKYADSIPLTFLGASHTNGRNTRRRGLAPYVHGSVAGGNPEPIDPDPPTIDLEAAMSVYARANGDTRIFEISGGKKYHLNGAAWKAVTGAFAAAGARVPYSKAKLTKTEINSIPNG